MTVKQGWRWAGGESWQLPLQTPAYGAAGVMTR